MELKQRRRALIKDHPKNWLHKAYLWEELSKSKKYVKGRLLDVGCAEKPYETMFKPLVTDYLGIDHLVTYHPQMKIDIFASAMSLPFKDCSFDTVLATQVIEHLPRPVKFFQESCRVLKPGGHLIITAPHIWMIHEEPYDFYRYTKYGLKHLSQKVGLNPLVIEPMGGFWATISIRLSYYFYDYFHAGPVVDFFLHQLCRLLQLVGYELEKLHHFYSDTHNYLLVAGKKT